MPEDQNTLFICSSSIMNKPLAEYLGTNFFMMLEQIHIENPILILTYNMYTKQEAIVSVKEGITGPTPVRRGSRQECLLSPLVYCIF